MTTALSIDGVSSGYGPVTILRDVTVEVSPGEIVAVLGSNGAGKSTLLKTIAGLLRPTAGTITANGLDITGRSAEQIVSGGVALVPEGRQLFGQMTVLENLILGAYPRRRQRQAVKDGLARVFDLFPILEDKQRQHADSLSGGQQQMVAIGRGLMAEPAALMLDEPSLGLAPMVIGDMFDALARLRKDGITILLVEQNALRTLELADRAYVLERGRVSVSGAAAGLRSDPRIRDAYLGLKVSIAQ